MAPLRYTKPAGTCSTTALLDVSAAMPARKILRESKRDYHTDVWTASDDQLEVLYSRSGGPRFQHPPSFLVDRPRAMSPQPKGGPRPTSAADIEAMLRERLPNDRAARTAVIVIDVTKPD
jgi:hypothetical protein